MNQLPAHLQNRQSRNLADDAVAGLGALMPPHVSIQGNTFTLIDSAGNEQPIGATMDCVVIDVSKINAKMFYGKKWTPDSSDPPDCWSSNGVGPSRDAVTPQARTCAECPKNERGSKISEISGASIKACRDEKWIAILLPQYPQMLFQLRILPGSFKNWQAYCTPFKQNGTDLSWVITRLSFVPKVNGVMQFADAGYNSAELMAHIDTVTASRKADELVGRNDVPRDPALMAPQAQPVQQIAAPTQQVQQPAPLAQPGAAFVETAPSSAGTFANAAAAPAQPEQQRRKRRTKAEIEADEINATAAQPAQNGTASAMAPFRPAPTPGFGASAPATTEQPQPQFGMQSGVAPNPELASALKSVFGDK